VSYKPTMPVHKEKVTDVCVPFRFLAWMVFANALPAKPRFWRP